MYYFFYKRQKKKNPEARRKHLVNDVLKAKMKWSLNYICIDSSLDAANSWLLSSSSKQAFLYSLCSKVHNALSLKRKFLVYHIQYGSYNRLNEGLC